MGPEVVEPLSSQGIDDFRRATRETGQLLEALQARSQGVGLSGVGHITVRFEDVGVSVAGGLLEQAFYSFRFWQQGLEASSCPASDKLAIESEGFLWTELRA